MGKTKKQTPISLDYLGLDSCKDDKERAARLLEDINRRKVELKQIKAKYKGVVGKVFADWKDEVERRFPSLRFQLFSSEDGIKTDFFTQKNHYDVFFCKWSGKPKNICMVRVSDPHTSIEDAVVSKLNHTLPWMYGNYCLCQEFDECDFGEYVFACFTEVLEIIEELKKENVKKPPKQIRLARGNHLQREVHLV